MAESVLIVIAITIVVVATVFGLVNLIRYFNMRLTARKAVDLELLDLFDEMNVDDALVLYNVERNVSFFGVRALNSSGGPYLRKYVGLVRNDDDVITVVETMHADGQLREAVVPVGDEVYAIHYRRGFVGLMGRRGIDALYRAFY